ncbi:oxalate decarboxylase [Moniliophthora roreri]|nr:oxalate decarboxylase [Moniliophthora roreri]
MAKINFEPFLLYQVSLVHYVLFAGTFADSEEAGPPLTMRFYQLAPIMIFALSSGVHAQENSCSVEGSDAKYCLQTALIGSTPVDSMRSAAQDIVKHALHSTKLSAGEQGV